MSFGIIQFTNQGKALQAKAQAGAQLNFTGIAVGDGRIGSQSVSDMTALINPIKSITLNKFKTMTGGKAVVGGVLSNQDIVTGFWWRELGLYASDPDLGEILYCYGNAGDLAEYIPSPGGAEILEKQVDIVSIVGDAVNIMASIDESLIYASAQDLLNHEGDYTLQVPYAGVTTGSANTYSIETPVISALAAGMAVSLRFHADSTGSSTLNWNGKGAKGIKKANGADATNLKAAGIYTLRYDGQNFILQGEGASGTAAASDLLSGKTASTDAGDVTGTMVNNGPAVAETINLTTQNQEYTIATGFHSGLRKIKAVISGLVANVIKAGTTVGGILGTFTSDATAAAADIRAGKTAYVNGVIVNGGATDNGPTAAETVNLTAQNQTYTIAAGFHSGLRTIKVVITNLAAGVIKAGVTVGGILGTFTADATATDGDVLVAKTYYRNGVKGTGNIPVMGSEEYTGWRRATLYSGGPISGRSHLSIPLGAYLTGRADGSVTNMGVFIDDSNFVSGNIKEGVSIFGLLGSYHAYGVGSFIHADNLQAPLISVVSTVGRYCVLAGNMTNLYTEDDYSSSSTVDIYRINPTTGAILASLLDRASTYSIPLRSKGGDLFFFFSTNSSVNTYIVRYNTSLSKVYEITAIANQYSGNNSILDMDCDTSGNVFFPVKSTATTYSKGLEKRDSAGTLVTGVYPSGATDIAHISVDSSGDVYVAYSNSTGGIFRYNNSLTKIWSGIDVNVSIDDIYARASDLYVYNTTSHLLERRSKTDGSLLASAVTANYAYFNIAGHDSNYLYSCGSGTTLEVRDLLTLAVVGTIEQYTSGSIISDGSSYIYLADRNTGYCKYQRELKYQIKA